jgi:hypothetical protein
VSLNNTGEDAMPYSTTPHAPAYDPLQPLPQHLDHKPVYALPYEFFDGIYAGNTDIRYISVGLAQYDHDHVSVKTMRHTGAKWTRQAEELPLHRPIDMTLFLAKVIFDTANASLSIPKGTLQNQGSDISIAQEQRSYGELASYNAFLTQNQASLKDRLNALRDTLNDLKNRGKI